VNSLLLQVTQWLNQIAGALAAILLWPIGRLPEIAGAVLISVVTGIGMLVIFKHTSSQTAVKRTRNRLRAELLALSLFRDSISVSLGCQFRMVTGACRLLMLALVPMLVMVIPISLLLGQLSLWWQARPLSPGQEAVVTVNFAKRVQRKLPEVELLRDSGFDVPLGPVYLRSKPAVCWNIAAVQPGYQLLKFRIDGVDVEKQVAVGEHLMRVSLRRPSATWAEMLQYPAEAPFPPDSPVQSIDIQYPESSSWVTGKDHWIFAWFIGSTVSALCFRPLLKVNL
jgi:hypothetical protein